ncbi:class F sortase [Actinacidiphila bryophytorum]|uniref:LPXTG-site transpeptidase (Sortase) family protein n=1 Tax=Actinacidiphila bryophytorum TaxID=1436133 RepID=A0A9W4MJ70_9ACTN|nr:class F sortase [Actinacidiphila bryophytorum]MBM9435799.1 class F sortase [Actinacidiphila bryophytorum]MBN6541642.1 class F sortase [Actinacidiphila bryophytorum]CAG7650175.1 LPXTG-site transpeptidase (Sortase) family protein [Actinacidiphila bryophytorum]
MTTTPTTGKGHPRRTAILLVVLAVACVAAGVTAVFAATTGGGSPPPRPGPAAAGQLPGHSMSPMSGTPSMPATPSRAAPAAPAPTRSGTLPASRPTVLDIPAVGIHSALLDLGLNKDGTIQVPGKPLQAGWYHGSPTPGQAGPSVILGHVDSYATGPAVFYRLGAMKPHQQIRVTRADHKVAVFTVDAVRSYDKAAFPTLDVYGNTPDAELRLITCSDWNAHTRSYDGNTVVFAQLTTG